MNSKISQLKTTKIITLVLAILGGIVSVALFLAGVVFNSLNGLCQTIKDVYSASQNSCSNNPGPGLLFGGLITLVISILGFVYVSKLNKEIDYTISAQRRE